jgi:hypothetical protein
VEVRFTKLDGKRHAIGVTRERGPALRCGPQPTDSVIPHDLVHAVVEEALGIRDGFWGAFAAGATFGGFVPIESRRHQGSGAKVLRRKGDAVMRAELIVNWCYRAWTGKSVDGRGVGQPQATAAQVEAACRALDEARRRWDATAIGEAFVWTFPG